jgi:hypothetical protein
MEGDDLVLQTLQGLRLHDDSLKTDPVGPIQGSKPKLTITNILYGVQ